MEAVGDAGRDAVGHGCTVLVLWGVAAAGDAGRDAVAVQEFSALDSMSDV